MTKEQQIEEMAKIIMGAIDETIQYKQAPANATEATIEAEALYKAGYRKIDDEEYCSMEWHNEQILHAEQEIERLNVENARLLDEKWKAQDDLECYHSEMKDKIKQAKIEVLESLKYGRGCAIKSYGNEWVKVVHLEDIDEMIANLKGGNGIMEEYKNKTTQDMQTPIVANIYIDKQALLDEFEKWNFGKHGQLEKYFADRVFTIIDKVPIATVEQIRTEAVKEFAVRLKEKAKTNSRSYNFKGIESLTIQNFIDEDDIDELLKEQEE